MTTETLPDHWKTGCSNAGRWVRCPGSKFIGGDDEAGAAALRGTLGHKILEALFNGRTPELTDEDRAIMEGWDDEDRSRFVDAVMQCYNLVHDEMETLGPADEILFETKIKSDKIHDHGGTVDVIIRRGSELHVIDFKFGRLAVEADDNYQVKCYLNLARQLFPDCTEFRGTIIQPAYRTETVDFAKWALDDFLFECQQAADPENTERKAGAKWCQHCPLNVECKEAAKMARQGVAHYERIANKDDPTPEDVELMERLVIIHKMAKTALEGATTVIKRWAGKGHDLNYHRITKQRRKQWAPDVSDERLTEIVGDTTDLYKKSLVTPNQACSALGISAAEFDKLFSDVLRLNEVVVLRAGPKPDEEQMAEFDPV